MGKRIVAIATLGFMTLCLALWQGAEKAAAADINVLPYYGANNFKVGNYFIYSYDTPSGAPDFTATVTEVTSGTYAGDYRLGDYEIPLKGSDWRILNWDNTGITIYRTGFEGDLNPPIIIKANELLDTPIKVPVNGSKIYDPDNNYWYYQKLSSSLTVPAGTFNDVLLVFDLDWNLPANQANHYFGLDSLPAISDVSWLAAGIGEIQVADIDAQTGDLVYLYQLKATNVPLPPSLILLGSGLLGLMGWRKLSVS